MYDSFADVSAGDDMCHWRDRSRSLFFMVERHCLVDVFGGNRSGDALVSETSLRCKCRSNYLRGDFLRGMVSSGGKSVVVGNALSNICSPGTCLGCGACRAERKYQTSDIATDCLWSISLSVDLDRKSVV